MYPTNARRIGFARDSSIAWRPSEGADSRSTSRRASPPADAPKTSWPSSRSKPASSARSTESSSAIRIFIDVPSREQDGERGTGAGLGGGLDRPAVARDDVFREGKTEAESLPAGLRREGGIEHAGQDVRRHAAARVGDDDRVESRKIGRASCRESVT